MRLHRSSYPLIAIVALGAALPALAAKTSFRYEQAQRVIKACVLYLEQPSGSWVNSHPGLMEGLRRSDLCPDDWVFQNPLAEAAAVTGRGTYIVKGRPEYWRVDLTDDTAPQLRGFDLIYVCAPILDVSSPLQVKGLRQAVDAGALLWVDNRVDRGAGTCTSVVNFPWAFSFGTVDQTGESDEAVLAANTRVALDTTHSLLNLPYALGPAGVRALGDLPEQWRPSDQPPTPLWQRYATNDFVAGYDQDLFRTVVEFAHINGPDLVDRLPCVMAGSYGSGSIVLTAGDVGADIVQWINDRLPGPNAQQAPDVQFALNMVQWMDRWEQARRRPTASAVSLARAGLPLEIDWQFPGPEDPVAALNIGPVVGTPVHSRGMVFAVTPSSALGAATQLLCFDATPAQDLDFDRDADDGLLRCGTCHVVYSPREFQPGDACTECGGSLGRDFMDWAWGRSYDMVWAVDLRGSPRAAAPTVATLNVLNQAGTAQVPLQVVLVSTVDTARTGAGQGVSGRVTCYNATTDTNVLRELPPGLRITGGVLWEQPIVGYSSTADVVALSTPVVHSNWVYVLATEYDSALPDLDGKQTERVYGRAHCFNLAPTGPSVFWEYPSPQADIDGDASYAGGPEDQRSLPPFHDPAWAANVNLGAGPESRPELPPEPGALPIVSQAVDTVDGRSVDALLTFGTTTTHQGAGGQVRTSGPSGSSEIALIPTPFTWQGAPPQRVFLLNGDYCLIRLNRAGSGGLPTTNLVNRSVTPPVEGTPVPAASWFGPTPSRLVRYDPATVREVLAELGRNEDPTRTQLGAEVWVDYAAVTNEQHFLPGPMRWRHEFASTERRTAPAAQVGQEIVASAGVPVYYTGNSGRSACIVALDASTGEERWRYEPLAAAAQGPVPTTGTPRIEGVTAPAWDGDTAIVGATLVDLQAAVPTSPLTSSVVGLKRVVDVSIYLRNAPANTVVGLADGDVVVSLYTSAAPVIDPACYRVDRYGRTITFPSEYAVNVTTNGGRSSLGPIYGRAVQVQWNDTYGIARGPELHVVPNIERFRHVPGYIRLRYYPVSMTPNPPVIRLRNGAVVSGWTVVNRYNPADPTSPSIDGWIAMPAAVAGQEVLVEYTGFSEASGGNVSIPNAALNLSYEVHQVPGQFGPSVSGPVVAGNAIHMGTQGFTGLLDGSFDDPIGPGGMRDTVLSLLWDRATGYVRSELSAPVQFDGSYGPATTLAAVSAPPSVFGDRIFVGAQILTAPGTPAGFGFVSGLKTRGLLICDGTRLVETTGTEPAWVCTGSSGPQRLQSFVGEDLRRPFSRPAKATHLGNGNLLVVDTGNNRVVEIDRSGRLVWPRDELGYEYYTSSANNNLQLSRPADAHRYISRRQVDTDGNGTPETWIDVWHTVIADTGNARVLDVETILHDPDNGYRYDGRQRHTVVTLTPSAIRLTGNEQTTRVRYTAAQPIFDPFNATLDGYLCAAANLDQVIVVEAGSRVVNPAANTVPPSGLGTWARWAWLYDADPTSAPHVSNQPLLFRNIKHVEYVRYGDSIYVTVTCSRYDGRLGAGGHALAAAGAGVFEFRMNVGGTPDTWGLIRANDVGGNPSWDEPFWHLVAGAPGSIEQDGYNYAGGVPRAITTLVTAAASYLKPWFPVCAKRLPSGNHLIVNSLSETENATYQNLGATSLGAVLGSHVFEVVSTGTGDPNPYNDTYSIPADRSVPRPGVTWADPISQPTYAEML